MTRARDVANIDGILTTKGDIYAATAASTPARLGVGSNGDTIVADSSTSTGLRYTAGTVNDNPVLNSAFQIWQRGTTSADSAGSPYTADRWQLSRSAAAGATVTRQVTGDTTNLPFIQYCARVQRNSGNTSSFSIYYSQTLETINSIPYVGKTVTVSFYARKGANYSATSDIIVPTLAYGTGTDQNVVTGMTGQTNIVVENKTLTSTWQRFSMTGTVAATATQLAFFLQSNPLGTAGANDYYEVTGVQIDIGSVALPFRTYAGTIQGELAACQRYYWRMTAASNAVTRYGLGFATSTTTAGIMILPHQTMRVKPSAIEYGGTIAVYDGTTVTNITSLAIETNSPDWTRITATVASGLTNFRPYELTANNDTASYFAFTAEL
jgi:hypothetical protein